MSTITDDAGRDEEGRLPQAGTSGAFLRSQGACVRPRWDEPGDGFFTKKSTVFKESLITPPAMPEMGQGSESA